MEIGSCYQHMFTVFKKDMSKAKTNPVGRRKGSLGLTRMSIHINDDMSINIYQYSY